MAERRGQHNNGGKDSEGARSTAELQRAARGLTGICQRLLEIEPVLREGAQLEQRIETMRQEFATLTERHAALVSEVRTAEAKLENLDATVEDELRQVRQRHLAQLEAEVQAEVQSVRDLAEAEIAAVHQGLAATRAQAETERQQIAAHTAELQQAHGELQRNITILQQTKDQLRRDVMAEIT